MRRIAAVIVLGMVSVSCVPQTEGPSVGAQCTSPPTIGAGASLFGCDLSGLDLRDAVLVGSDLRGAILVGADLSGADLSGANLEGANLTNAKLEGADLTNAVLSGAILIGTFFLLANLTGATFDFGRSYGPDGTGGAAPTPSGSCQGAYCPGYNEATVDTGDPLCDPGLAEVGFFVHRTEQQLIADGARSVVTDATTDFSGATFDFSGSPAPRINVRALSLASANFSGATFVNPAFVCQIADGARLPGVTISGTGVGSDAAFFYHLSLRGANLAGSTIQGAVFSDVDLTNARMLAATLTDATLEVPGIFPIEVNEPLPFHLLRLDGVNFRQATIGGVVNPYTGGSQVRFGGTFEGLFRTTSWAGARFDLAHITNLESPAGDFGGTQAAGATVTGPVNLNGSSFLGSTWTGGTWSQPIDWEGATCADGSAGSAITPCF